MLYHYIKLSVADFPVTFYVCRADMCLGSWWLQVGQVSTPTANVIQRLVKTIDANKVDDLKLILLQEQEAADERQQKLPLTIVFVERKARCDQASTKIES